MTKKMRDGTRAVQAFLPFVPPRVTHNDLKAAIKYVNSRPVPYIRKSDRLRAAEDDMRPHVAKIAPDMPLRGPLREVLKVCYPTGGKHAQGEPMTNKPDLDNWIKPFNDILQDCKVIRDDAHIADMHVTKVWADPAGVWVRVEEIKWGAR